MDVEQEIADCVGAIYEAATGGLDWYDVGARLRRLLDAESFYLHGGGSRSVLMSDSEALAAYADHFHQLNPYVARAQRDYAADRAAHLGKAQPGEALVSDEIFLRSEYFNDFARPYGHRYMIGGMLGVREPTPLALYRGDDHRAFDSHDVRRLQILLPHLQRGLELDARMGVTRMSLAALEALPTAVALVDAELGVLFLNAAARALTRGAQAPLTVRRAHGGQGGQHLSARSRSQTARLLGLVASAARGGAGGFVRLEGDDGALAVQASPAPNSLALDRPPGLMSGAALLLLQRVRRPTPPPLTMLCEILGLSFAEAEVAAALFGGRSAEEVARSRGVSLATVRNQIRAILEKADADNLRDLERLLAELTSLSAQKAS